MDTTKQNIIISQKQNNTQQKQKNTKKSFGSKQNRQFPLSSDNLSSKNINISNERSNNFNKNKYNQQRSSMQTFQYKEMYQISNKSTSQKQFNGYCTCCFDEFNSQNIKQKFCSCNVCVQCLENWSIEKIQNLDFDLQNDLLCCANVCGVKFTPQQLLQSLDDKQKFRQILFKKFCQTKEDIRHCPKCEYRGFINLKQTCKDFLQCEKCGHEWEDIALKNQDFTFSQLLIYKKEIKSYIYKFLFTKNCPSCSISIQKSGGCPWMTCRKCKQKFCWKCMTLSKNHKNIRCFIKSFLLSIILMSPLYYLLHKRGYWNDFKNQIKQYMTYNSKQDYFLMPYFSIRFILRIISYHTIIPLFGLSLSQLYYHIKNYKKYKQQFQDFQGQINKNENKSGNYNGINIDNKFTQIQKQQLKHFLKIQQEKRYKKIVTAFFWIPQILVMYLWGKKQEFKNLILFESLIFTTGLLAIII